MLIIWYLPDIFFGHYPLFKIIINFEKGISEYTDSQVLAE
ncbi:MAG: hypothetical protein JWM28_4093 [Chitinophagaceae bacterium]|nr:hypothetical protein [Chitinophagaceae bacterium]